MYKQFQYNKCDSVIIATGLEVTVNTAFSKTALIYRYTSTGGAVPLFHTQPSSDTTMRQLARNKPASVGLCVA